MLIRKLSLVSLASIGLMSVIAGCNEPAAPPAGPVATPATPATATPGEAGHGHSHSGHGAGPHDGTLADWGGGKYHVEFTVDHGKQEATVYILGGDEKTPTPVKTDKLLLSINDPKFQVDLAATPLEGEKDGVSSRFVGKHENLGKVQEFAGTISGEVDGTPYAGDFKEEPHGEHGHDHPVEEGKESKAK